MKYVFEVETSGELHNSISFIVYFSHNYLFESFQLNRSFFFSYSLIYVNDDQIFNIRFYQGNKNAKINKQPTFMFR